MGDPLTKVKPGDPLSIPAPAYNAFVDAARDYQNRQRNQGAGMKPTPSSQTAVLVKNIGDVDCPRFGVLAIAGPLIDPADNAGAFAEQVMFTATKPAGTGVEPFVVALEPIPIGKVGRAVCAGISIARVKFVATDDRYAQTTKDTPGYLTSCKAASQDHSSGGSSPTTVKGQAAVRIIWPNPAGATGEQWAVIDMEFPKPHGHVLDTTSMSAFCGGAPCSFYGFRFDGQGRVEAIKLYGNMACQACSGTYTYRTAWFDLQGNEVT